jgi:hypothetical protein
VLRPREHQSWRIVRTGRAACCGCLAYYLCKAARGRSLNLEKTSVALHPAKVNIPLYLQVKRARKSFKRSQREWKSHLQNALHAEEFDRRFGPSSKIVAMLAGDGAPLAEVLRKKAIRFQLPATFSILDKPEVAIGSVGQFASQLRAQRLGSIYLDFTAVAEQDLGANALLDVLVDELQTQARRTGRRIRWHGTYPKRADDRRFLRAMGVIKRLQIAHEFLDQNEAAAVVLFDERCKHYTRSLKATQADKKSRVTQGFADHVNDCLGRMQRELTPAARSRMCQYVGEIIDNAEEHGQMGDWSIQGYLDTSRDIPICEIAIFNFGRTIAQTFEALDPASYTRRQVQRYIDLHRKGGLFRRDWRTEDLFTLIALQGSVSTKNGSHLDTRGNGTVDLISFFQRVHQECSSGDVPEQARMALLSGSTFILFDGTYPMQPNANGVNIIAFNPTNDLELRPDPQYVRALAGVDFPGTMICLQFPLALTALRASE